MTSSLKLLTTEKEIIDRLHLIRNLLEIDHAMGDFSKRQMEQRFGYALAAVGLNYADWERMYSAE